MLSTKNVMAHLTFSKKVLFPFVLSLRSTAGGRERDNKGKLGKKTKLHLFKAMKETYTTEIPGTEGRFKAIFFQDSHAL